MTSTETKQITDLINTMRHLRSENGCPWDREQTPESLRPYILEEAYELIDAIDQGDTEDILSELGDLLLQVVFQAQIFSERGLFGIGDIAESINQKLLRRHPQIFTNNTDNNDHPNWEQIKQRELIDKGKPTDFASRLPKNLPSLKMADKVGKYLTKCNKETVTEQGLDRQLNIKIQDLSEETLAQTMFQLVCLGQKSGIDSDLALRKFLKKLILEQT